MHNAYRINKHFLVDRHSKNTTSKRTSLLTSRRSSTKSTTPPGIAFAEEISAHTWHMRRNISSTFTLDKLLFYCSSLDKLHASFTHSLVKSRRTMFFHKAAFNSTFLFSYLCITNKRTRWVPCSLHIHAFRSLYPVTYWIDFL